MEDKELAKPSTTRTLSRQSSGEEWGWQLPWRSKQSGKEEKETQEEFEGIQREQERVVGELNKKISDYKAELDDLAEFTKHKVGLTPQS